MGCAGSEPRDEFDDRLQKNSSSGPSRLGKFAIEKFSWQTRNATLLERSNGSRKPSLKVPERVIAPNCPHNDIGDHNYRSMHNSPQPTIKNAKFKNSRKPPPVVVDEIDDIDEPPNHETYAEYIMHLDQFMWDVSVHPDYLLHRVMELRGRISPEDSDSDDESVMFEDIPGEHNMIRHN